MWVGPAISTHIRRAAPRLPIEFREDGVGNCPAPRRECRVPSSFQDPNDGARAVLFRAEGDGHRDSGVVDGSSSGFRKDADVTDDATDPAHMCWDVSTSTLNREQACEAAAWIQATFPGSYADAVDPRSGLSMVLDRWTAEAVRDGLARLVAAGGDVGSMLEELDEWLAAADPYAEDEERWQRPS